MMMMMMTMAIVMIIMMVVSSNGQSVYKTIIFCNKTGDTAIPVKNMQQYGSIEADYILVTDLPPQCFFSFNI